MISGQIPALWIAVNAEYRQRFLQSMNKITEENIEFEERKLRLINEDQKQDSQLRMVWFALLSSLLYPVLVIVCFVLRFPDCAKLLTDMSDIYFISVMGLVGVYFGSDAYIRRS